jgi:hypothetical protein
VKVRGDARVRETLTKTTGHVTFVARRCHVFPRFKNDDCSRLHGAATRFGRDVSWRHRKEAMRYF